VRIEAAGAMIVIVLVSPTGLEGFCKGLNTSWAIPFKGFVNAA